MKNPLEREYNVKLYRMIRKRFRSQKAFSIAAKTTQEKVSRVLWKNQELSEQEKTRWAGVLQVSKDTL